MPKLLKDAALIMLQYGSQSVVQWASVGTLATQSRLQGYVNKAQPVTRCLAYSGGSSAQSANQTSYKWFQSSELINKHSCTTLAGAARG